jgi:hypothetical protein
MVLNRISMGDTVMTNRELAEQIDRDINLAGEEDIAYLTRVLDDATVALRPETNLILFLKNIHLSP